MTSKQKLELTWIGKDKTIKVEPRILIHDPSKDYGDKNTDNMLIFGDNLLALKALEQEYAGKVKCIYIDPPYNTGSAFEHYDDNLEHSIWLSLMKERIVILRNLLADTGSIWIQIDDEEQAYLKVLCDEIFGRGNFINMISVNMKNIAGASGGGEDKRIKKNVEYILIYAKDYNQIRPFVPAYSYTPIIKMVEDYRLEGKSWKYTTALLDPGEKIYVGSTLDGDGNEIKIYKRINYIIKPISALMREHNLSEEQVYAQFAKYCFQTAMPQSSIRPRIMAKVQEIGIESDLYSVDYVPKTGRNKGQHYEQFYKGESFRLFAWLKDVSEEIDGKIYKRNLQGTYWDFVGETKNLTKEGDVEFPNGKKAEALISRIVSMATQPGELILDSFLGSGTTAAVAHKMGRKYIGIELGEHCHTHCIPRLQQVIDGTDQGGISKTVGWKGGGGFKYYYLAPSLLNKDKYGQYVISKEYNADMLAAAMAKHEGFLYAPDQDQFWKQGKSSENDYIYTTTNHVGADVLAAIAGEMKDDESLLICCKSFDAGVANGYSNITVKKIPGAILGSCEFDKANYNLNIINPPVIDEEE